MMNIRSPTAQDKPDHRPGFIITVDVEGDNLVSRPRSIQTHNARFLPRFQDLCQRYGFKATYLVNYEMACDADCIAFGREVLEENGGEIGMHLHAWNSPPISPITPDDFLHSPYLYEYPKAVMRQKVRFLTDLLEDTFGSKMTCHRAGRWGFDRRYAHLLLEHGYKIDSSVTPHISWANAMGDPSQSGGPDYTQFPSEPYFIDLQDISRLGTSDLLEVPITTEKIVIGKSDSLPNGEAAIVRWLRPSGRNGKALISMVERVLEEARTCAVLMIHSSELMPGDRSNIPDAQTVESIYRDLERLFQTAHGRMDAITLNDLYDRFQSDQISSGR
jgi:hypothetical protein